MPKSDSQGGTHIVTNNNKHYLKRYNTMTKYFTPTLLEEMLLMYAVKELGMVDTYGNLSFLEFFDEDGNKSDDTPPIVCDNGKWQIWIGYGSHPIHTRGLIIKDIYPQNIQELKTLKDLFTKPMSITI